MLQQQEPIIVRIVEQPVRETTISDVIFGSIGLVGVLLVAALLLGALLGGLLIGIRILRARYGYEPPPDSETFRVTPTS
jgi:uncharacterized protein YacL